MSEFANLARVWREAGLMPPEGTPIPERKEFDVKTYLKEQREAAFKENCPVEFQQEIDRSKIGNLAAWDLADKWSGTHPGIWLWSHGTGVAKTRMLWRKFGELHVNMGRMVCRISGANLAEEYHDAYNHSRTSSFYARLMKFPAVFLDDLDKMHLGEASDGFAEQAIAQKNRLMLRELFDKFYEHHVPVMVTANETIDWFEERIGASGARRMRAVCEEIHFEEGTK